MTVLVVDAAAPLWVARIEEEVPGLSVVGARDAVEAVALGTAAEVVIGLAHAVTAPLLAAVPGLRWVQALTAGVDPLDRLLAGRPGVALTSLRGIHGPQMSELAFLLMLGLLRDIRGILARQDDRAWVRQPQPLLFGRHAVILGVGAIAEALAARCQAFGMRVTGLSDSRREAPGFDAVLPRAALRDAAAGADVLVVLAPATAATRHLVDAAVLAAMRPDALLLNLSRGSVVDEAALAEALAGRRLAGAGLDVFAVEPLPQDSPLWALPNVIITPHLGGMSDIHMQQAMPLLAENLRRFRQGGTAGLLNLVGRGG